MPNQRISELQELSTLRSNQVEEFINYQPDNTLPNSTNISFLTATEKSANNKISYQNLKKSIIDTSLSKSKNQTVNGQKLFKDRCEISSITEASSPNLYIEKFINNKHNESTSALFEQNILELNADKEIAFYSNQSKKVFFSNNGCLNINSENDTGAVNVGGDAYFSNIYADNIQGSENQEDEVVCFRESIPAGSLNKKIILPKTFKYKPIINASLFSNSDTQLISFNLLNVKENSLEVNFHSAIPSSNYYINITALAPSILSDGTSNPNFIEDKIESFHQTLNPNGQEYTISFPASLNNPPVITLSIEGESNIPNFTISSVNNNSYTVKFETEPTSSFIIHTLLNILN